MSLQGVIDSRGGRVYRGGVPVLEKRRRDDPRRQATEQAFLNATRELLDEGASFADLNVSQIAERAGRTRSAFYVHFEDRRALLLALLGGAGRDAVSALSPFLTAEGAITRSELTAATSALLAAFRSHATLVRAVTEAASYDDEIGAQWSAIVRQIIDGSARRLEAAGLSAEAAVRAATALVWMMERTCYQQAVRDDTGLSDDQLVVGLSDVWWSTIATPPSSP